MKRPLGVEDHVTGSSEADHLDMHERSALKRVPGP